MPRKCHLKLAGCFTMQIRCKTMRPTGYLAMVVIVVGLANDTRQPGRSFKKIGQGRRARKRIGCRAGESSVTSGIGMSQLRVATRHPPRTKRVRRVFPPPLGEWGWNSGHLPFEAFDFCSDEFGDTMLDEIDLIHGNTEASRHLFGRPTFVYVKVENLPLLRVLTGFDFGD